MYLMAKRPRTHVLSLEVVEQEMLAVIRPPFWALLSVLTAVLLWILPANLCFDAFSSRLHNINREIKFCVRVANVLTADS